MSWARVQGKSATNNGGSNLSLTATFTSTPITGNKIIVAFAHYSTLSSVKDGNGNNLTQLATITSTSGTQKFYLYAYDVPATPSTSVVVTNATTGPISIAAQEVSGLLAGNTTAMLDGTPGTLGTSTVTGTGTASGPTYSSTAANEYLVEAFSDQGIPATVNTPAGYAGLDGANADGGANSLIAWKNSTGGAETVAWTSANWGAGADGLGLIAVAFQLAASGGAPMTPFIPHRMPLGV